MQIFHLADRSDDPHSLVERGIGNFLTTLAVAMPDTNEKKSSKRIRRTMFVATIPLFLPCCFPRRVKLEIDVLKKKKRKNWRLKFHSFPAEENCWMAALIVPSRIFGYAPLRVCVCERRSSCTQIASDYLHRDPLTSGIRSPFIRAASAFPTQHRWKKEAAILPPLLAVSLSTSKYSLQIIREIFLY